MLKLFLNYLAISANITTYFHEYNIGKYQGGENVTIDYIENFSPFSTSVEEHSIISTVFGQNNCEIECNLKESCEGYTLFEDRKCNLLNDLGNSTDSNIEAVSFRKFSRYNYLSNHTIDGIVHYTGQDNRQTVVYLDTNHDGFLNEGEPNMTTANREFKFTNLTTGFYLVRQISPRKCYELYPGEYGVSLSYSGKGYFDYVRYFSPINRIEGGMINHENVKPSLGFILGNNDSTYLSFYENYSIVMGMSDDIIINGDGTDIDFYLLGKSSVSGNVSVSRDGDIFTFLGVLDVNNTSFDINVTTPIKFIKIDFFNTLIEDTRPLNIIKVTGLGRVYYSPSFAYYVPSHRNNLIFINDCTYYYSCYTFCDFHVNPYYYRTSCKHGCTIFKDTGYCDCNYDHNANYLYGENFNKTECEIGCNYEMNRHFYPEYEVFDKSMGYEGDKISSYSSLDTSLESCNSDKECHGVTFSGDNTYSTQKSFQRIYMENSYFLVKRDLLNNGDIPYMTSTVTSTPTSTVTSTPTSTVTTTPTSTATTTPTSTATTTPTSTVTNIMIDIETPTGLSGTDIAILAILIILLLIITPILIVYLKTKKKNSIKPKLQTSYINPVYQGLENDNNHDYMDISEQN